MKIKKEFIILAVIIVALGVYLIFNINRSGVKSYSLPKLAVVNKSEITKVKFTTPESRTTLEYDKGKDLWRISPQDYPVEKTKMDSILQQTAELRVTDLISDKQAYDKFGLEASHKINVTVYKDNTLVRDFDIGKVAEVTNHAYIKLADDPNVYSVNLNLRTTFDYDTEEMRDKVVMDINQDSIRQIHLVFEDTDITLNKTTKPPETEGGSETVQWLIAGDEKEAELYQVNTMLNSLSSLACDSYLPEDQVADFTNPYLTLELKGDKDYTLQALEAGEDNMHPAISSENKYQFKLIGWKVNNFTKTKEDLIK